MSIMSLGGSKGPGRERYGVSAHQNLTKQEKEGAVGLGISGAITCDRRRLGNHEKVERLLGFSSADTNHDRTHFKVSLRYVYLDAYHLSRPPSRKTRT